MRSSVASPLGFAHRLASAAPWRYWVGFGIGRLASLFVLPIVARAVGTAGFGRFEVALAIMMAATIVLDAGLGASVIRFSDDERFRKREVVGSAVVLQLLAAATAAFICIPILAVAGPQDGSFSALSGVLLAFCFVEGLAVVGSGVVRAERRDDIFLTLSFGRFVVTTSVGTLGALLAGVEGALLGIALGGTPFAAYAVYTWIGARTVGRIAIWTRLAKYGVPLAATTLASWTLALSDRLFLQRFVPPEELGQYSANYRLGSLVLVFIASPLGLAWLPHVQRLGPAARARSLRNWTLGFSILALVSTAALAIVAPAAVRVIFGASFTADRLIVLLVAASGWLAGLWYLAATPLLVSDRTAPMAAAAAGAVIGNLALNVILISTLETDGAALATVMSYALLTGLTFVTARRHRTD